MSITKTMYTGVSGMNAMGRAIAVVGDNIANVSTTGYKAERAIFADLLGRSMMSTDQAGSGVRMAAITREFAQGTLMTTDSPTDLALNGKGFFIVDGNLAGQQGNFYTRAGQFSLDNQGNLVDPQGFVVQGYLVNSAGTIDNQLTDLTIANNTVPPQQTTDVTINAQLNSNENVQTFDINDPGDETSSSQQTPVTVYDSLGNAHQADVYFTKTADNAWEWHAVVDQGEIGGTPGVNAEVANGQLTFTTDGQLDTSTDIQAWTDTFTGASPQTVSFNFGDPLVSGGTGTAGSVQYAGADPSAGSGTTGNVGAAVTQNGYASGDLVGVGVQNNGDVMAIYTNGEQRMVGQVAVATFEADGQLARAGDNLWMATQESGEARVGNAATGSAGSITASALEMSTVDLAEEFVNLIAYQRGFQANSRTITTADQMYQEAVNLKR
jgi:flagellar hook protein FlgE